MTEPNEIEYFFLTLKRNGLTNKINIDVIVPKREYNSDIVDYYKLAFSSNDPYIQYISFYHIIEYFYDEVFKRKMIEDLTDKITQPDFSYKNEDQVFGLATFIKNRIKMNVNEGQGNETESLKYVLKEYINIEELKNKLDKNDLKFYSENIVSFSKGPTISWRDEPGIYTNITKRIYFTRNALIHSKSGKKDKMYKPYRDEMLLQKEIPLVRVIAEMIIINSSKVI